MALLLLMEYGYVLHLRKDFDDDLWRCMWGFISGKTSMMIVQRWCPPRGKRPDRLQHLPPGERRNTIQAKAKKQKRKSQKMNTHPGAFSNSMDYCLCLIKNRQKENRCQCTKHQEDKNSSEKDLHLIGRIFHSVQFLRIFCVVDTQAFHTNKLKGFCNKRLLVTYGFYKSHPLMKLHKKS